MSDERAGIDFGILATALRLPGFDGRAAQRPMEPAFRGRLRGGERPQGAPRDAAALAYVYEAEGVLHLPLTLRHEELREHRGQVSLPGGRPQPGEGLWETAWREAIEEIGLDPLGAQRLGVLTPVYIPVTHTNLHVHVARGAAPTSLAPNPGEVARIEVAALADLLLASRRARRVLSIQGREVDVPYFDLAGLFVWGATAMALSELAERLRCALAP